jgi:hypothetical protein
MPVWCDYCEDQLRDSFSIINRVPILNSNYSSTCEIICWYESNLKYSAHSKIFLLLTQLHYCDCCTRHQINKPCVPKRWVTTRFPTISNLDDNCMCDCRFMARMICRSWNNSRLN